LKSVPIVELHDNPCVATSERTEMADFFRNVHCVMGLPIDAMSMDQAVRVLQNARISREKCFFSTPNLNFVIASQKQPMFRESVCMSNLSLADGMPLVWVAKMLDIPIRERVSGSDLFDRLCKQTESLWRVFFFGGPKGVGQTACLAIGDQSVGVLPTGYIYPGFVNNEEMSRDDILECINLSEPDMVVVSLGAAKGQDWICRNHNSINAPVIGHLGAVINFVAGSVQRAPSWMQRSGLEWVWRAKEESTLVKRYANDGLSFLRLLATRVLPLAWYQATRKPSADALRSASVDFQVQSTTSVMRLSGAWNTTNLTPVREAFTRAQEAGTPLDMHMAEVSSIDSAFVGLLLLLEQSLATRNLSLRLVGTPISIRRYLALSCVSHLVME
jgi:N-acetylglucosaminyldiphosphoundecaprenol N-acetyl-beta-D-mannosaminyltransferase